MPKPKTFHEKNFDQLQATARQMALILTQNPHLSRDQTANMEAYFKAVEKAVKLYTDDAKRNADVYKSFVKAKSEWKLYKGGRADARQRIINALNEISNARYQPPPRSR